MHPWHDLPTRAPVKGDAEPDDVFHAVIEIPRGGMVKYELDKASGLLRADRVLYSAVYYPANYGFLPRTLGDDGDALDVLVLMSEPVVPLCLVRCRPIGALPMRDEAGGDEKIIAVCVDDPAFRAHRALDTLPPHVLRQIERFFMDYKALEDKWVETSAYLDRTAADAIIADGERRYAERYAERFGEQAAGEPTSET